MTKPAIQVGVHEAKTRLSELLRAVAGGQEVDILRAGEPVAKIIPFPPRTTRELGFDAHLGPIPDSFDDPLPPEVEESFYR